MALPWAAVKMRIHRRLSWACKTQNTLLSSEGGPPPPKSTVTAILGEHHTAETATQLLHYPSLDSGIIMAALPWQFFPLLTCSSTLPSFRTPFLLSLLRPEVLLWGQGSMEGAAFLFIRCNSRLILHRVIWVSWRVRRGCDSTTQLQLGVPPPFLLLTSPSVTAASKKQNV